MTHMSLLLTVVVAFVMAISPDAIEGAPPRGVVIAVHAVPDGTALVAWTTPAADYITHVRSDGTVLTAELARERLDADALEKLDDIVDECGGYGCGTYRGKLVTAHEHSIWIDGIEHELPQVRRPTSSIPVRLWPLERELPQFVGIDTTKGPIILDLETAGIVWSEDSDDRIVRDGTSVYIVGDDGLRAFDPLTFSARHVADDVDPDQIGGGYVWTYARGEHAITAPVVRAIRPGAPAPVTASR